MKHVIIFLLLMGFIGATSVGCYYDNEEELYPNPNACDTVAVSFSADILPVLQSQCLSCHAADIYTDTGGGYNLDGHANVKVSADDNKLYPAIAHTGDYPMPKSAAKLDDCTIAQFKAWIDNGALDN